MNCTGCPASLLATGQAKDLFRGDRGVGETQTIDVGVVTARRMSACLREKEVGISVVRIGTRVLIRASRPRCPNTSRAAYRRTTEMQWSCRAPWLRPRLASAEYLQRREDVSHCGVAAIEHHVRVADGREVAGTVDEQELNPRGVAFEDAMNEPPGEVSLLCVDEDDARERGASVAREQRCLDAVFDRRDIEGMETQSERRRGQQLEIGAVEQDGGSLVAYVSSRTPGLRGRS